MTALYIGLTIGVLAYAALVHIPEQKELGGRWVQWWPTSAARLCPFCIAFWLGIVLVLGWPNLWPVPAVAALTAELLARRP